jgi:hypothetical protein
MNEETTTTPWRWSEAKKLLRDDIRHGLCAGKTAREVYAMRTEYQCYERQKFETNYRNLKKAIAEEATRAASDASAFAHDKALFPALKAGSKPYPIWQGSDAEALLEKHVAEGRHKVMTPMDMWSTFPAYQRFPLKTFRGHIYNQVVRKGKARSYWLNRKKKMEAKKASKKQKK